MKIFNQGQRSFLAYGVEIIPGRFTDLPDEEKFNVHAEKLLKDYPDELVTDATARAAGNALQRRVSELEEQVKGLMEENRNLVRIANGERDLRGPSTDTLGNDAPGLEGADKMPPAPIPADLPPLVPAPAADAPPPLAEETKASAKPGNSKRSTSGGGR